MSLDSSLRSATPPTLGELMRRRRLDADLTQRDLATRMGFHDSLVAAVEHGERAPSALYLDKFAEALGMRSSESAELWDVYRAIPVHAQTGRPTASLDRERCPYRGLYAFREQDAPLFHGREPVVRRLVSKLHLASLVGIVGASGSGKSSIVFAGLLPALRKQGPWAVASFRPGATPFESLAAALVDLGGSTSTTIEAVRETNQLAEVMRTTGLAVATGLIARRLNRRLLIFADQFEELYTLCQDHETVRAFLDCIVGLAEAQSAADGAAKFVMTLRGDFYSNVVGHRPFSDTLQDNVVHLPPMNRQELRRAIVEPAKVYGLQLEDGLVDRILDAVGHEPGNLPLLEFSLMLLWENQDNGVLTHAAYERHGELAGAIATQAEEVYLSLAPEQQDTARQLLTWLVRIAQPGEEVNDARRRTPLDEVAVLPRVGQVIAALTDARLLVSDADEVGRRTVEVAHEAVIRNWDRLRAWLVEDRQFLLWQQRLRQWQREWLLNRDDDAALLRGRILIEAETWVASKGRESFAPALLEYVDRSIAARDALAGQQALDRIELLRTARDEEVLGIIDNLNEYRDIVDARLRELLSDQPGSERWRFRVALLPSEPAQADYIVDELETLTPSETLILREALSAYSDYVSDTVWLIAQDDRASKANRIRAAVLLARYAPNDPRWAVLGGHVASIMISENPLHLQTWVEALRPVRLHMLDALHEQFAETSSRDSLRETAATLLLALGADQSRLLARMASEAMPQTYEAILAAVRTVAENDNATTDELRQVAACLPGANLLEGDRVKLGMRRAVAACTLLRLDQSNGITQLFRRYPDEEVNTQFIHQVRSRGVSADALVHLIEHADQAASRYTLILGLGSYGIDDLGSSERDLLLSRLDEWSYSDPDAGVHAACAWLADRWKRQALEKSTVGRPYDPTGARNWFTATLNESQVTFTVFRPTDFLMGSPDTENERSDYESPRQPTRLSRAFALCHREVTRGEFERFMADTDTVGLPDIDEWSPLAIEPIVAATWYESVGYCAWLTQTTMANANQLFGQVQHDRTSGTEKNSNSGTTFYHAAQGEVGGLTDTSHPGFRLPTEAEWEYACRADTTTPYSFGSDRRLLTKYAWFTPNSELKTHRAGIKRPNQAGLFNIHGQCWEWCLDWYGPYSSDLIVDPVGPEIGDRRVVRGGCWNLDARYLRSACRNAHIPVNRNYIITFRIACTIPEIDKSWTPDKPNPLAWSG